MAKKKKAPAIAVMTNVIAAIAKNAAARAKTTRMANPVPTMAPEPTTSTTTAPAMTCNL